MPENEKRQYSVITPEEVMRVDAALARTNGNFVHAAQVLGVSTAVIQGRVRWNPHLRAKWGKGWAQPPKPSLATDIHRDPGLEPFAPGEIKAVQALDKQDALLHSGWEQLGFNDEERGFLAGLQRTYATNLKSTMDLAYGGAAHANTRLLLALEDLHRKLQHIRENPDQYHRVYMTEHGERESKGPDEYYEEYYSLLIKVSGELRKMGDSVTKANELRLKMEKLKLEREADQRKQAGWTPTGPKPVEVGSVTG